MLPTARRLDEKSLAWARSFTCLPGLFAQKQKRNNKAWSESDKQVLVHKASNLGYALVSINDKDNVLEQSSQSIIWQISDLQRDLASAASCLYCAVETLIQS